MNHTFKRTLFEILTYLSVFTIGGYVTSTVLMGRPVEPYRWAFTSICFVIFRFAIYILDRERARARDNDQYYDAECHVFRSYSRIDNSYGWQYFYTDQDGRSQQSCIYVTKTEAVHAYLNRPSYERGFQTV